MTAAGKSLAASVAGHVLVVAALIWLVGRAPSLQLPAHAPANSVDVAFAPPIPAPPPLVAPEPPPPPPLAEEPPPPPPLTEEPPPPPALAEEPPPPPPKPVVRRPVRPPVEHRVVVRPERPPPQPRPARPEPRMAEPEPRFAPPQPRFAPPQPRYVPPMQTASLPPAPAPAAPAPGPMITGGYRAALSAWLESHKQYPQTARERGEQGRVVLRFRVARNGRVLSYSVAGSSGYPDLDAAVDTMMRGAALPPFPPEMASPEIEVSVTVRFALAR